MDYSTDSTPTLRSHGCCTSEDFAVFIALGAGLCCAASVVVDWQGHSKDEPEEHLWRLCLVQIPIAIAGVFAFLFSVPCCRRKMPSGVLAGSASGLLGVALALGMREVWERHGSAFAFVSSGPPPGSPYVLRGMQQYFLGVTSSPEPIRIVESAEHLETLVREVISDEVGRLPLVASLICASTACVLEFGRKRCRARYRSCCTVAAVGIFGIITYLATAALTALAVFAALPLSHRHATLLGQFMEAPPKATLRGPHDRQLLVGVLGGGAWAASLTMLSRPTTDSNSWVRATLLGTFVAADLVGIAAELVDLPILRGVVGHGSTFAWQALATAALLETVVALLHAGVVLPKSKRRAQPEVRRPSAAFHSDRVQHVPPQHGPPQHVPPQHVPPQHVPYQPGTGYAMHPYYSPCYIPDGVFRINNAAGHPYSSIQ